MEHYRKDTLKPIEPLTITRPNGVEITVNALGYGMMKPAIDFMKHTTTASGRDRLESIGFTVEEFDMLYDYLTKAKQHWGGLTLIREGNNAQ